MRAIEELREMLEERAVLAAVAPQAAEWHTNTLLRQLPALLDVAEAAEQALAVHEDVACSCVGCARVRAAFVKLREAL